MDAPKVYVIEREGRGFVFRWKDETGKWTEKKCYARTRRSAERAASDHEKELMKATNGEPEIRTWADFCDRYQEDHLQNTSTGNQAKWDGVRKHFREYLESQGMPEPSNLPILAIKVDLLFAFEAWMKRKMGSAATVHSYMKTLRAGLSFAAEIEWMMPIPRRRKRRGTQEEAPEETEKMKGRPVTGEEVDRLLWAVDKVLEKPRQEGFRQIIKAYWYGGLRRGEPLDFHWSLLTHHRPQLDGDFPVVYYSSLQKNRKNQRIAITKEFAALLESMRKPDGWVFNPLGKNGDRLRTGNSLGRVMKSIAVRANVVLASKTDDADAVYATAQNLRQGLAHRLHAAGVPPATLKHVMRHSDWKTTMLFYVGHEEKDAAADLKAISKTETNAAEAAKVIGSL